MSAKIRDMKVRQILFIRAIVSLFFLLVRLNYRVIKNLVHTIQEYNELTPKPWDFVECENGQGTIMAEEWDARAVSYPHTHRAFEYKSSCRKPK